MKLYTNPASPFARKVRLCLHELGRADDVGTEAVFGHPTDPGTMPLGVNPLGKLPCLARDDGTALYDSRVITRFLNDHFGGGLYPAAPRLYETLTLEATAEGIMEAAVLIVYETRSRKEGERSDDWVAGQRAKVERALSVLEDRWMSHLKGGVDMGVLAVGAALGYLDFRQPERDWRASRPELGAWEAAFVQRPSMQATLPVAL